MKIVVGESDAVLDRVATKHQQNPVGMMGPFYVGALVEWLFLGVLCNQAWNYYRYFPKDSLWVKRLVGVIFVLSVMKAAQAFTITWDKNIVGFGSWRVAASVPWNIWIQPPASSIVSTTAQTFFVWRCFTLTGRNWWMLGGLTAAMLSVLGLSFAIGVRYAFDPYHSSEITKLAIPMLILGTLIDVAITAIVLWKLVKSRNGFNKDTDTTLKRLIAITWEAALPPALCQTVNLITFMTRNNHLWDATFNMITPSLYVFSLMHTLNSRVRIRLGSSMGTSHENSQQPIETPGDRRHTGNVLTLSTFKKDRRATGNQTGTMPVHVQTETFVHTSEADNHHTSQLVGNPHNSAAMRDTKMVTPSNQSEESVESSGWEKEPEIAAQQEKPSFGQVPTYTLETRR